MTDDDRDGEDRPEEGATDRSPEGSEDHAVDAGSSDPDGRAADSESSESRSRDHDDVPEGREGPLGELANEVERRSEAGDGPDLPSDELFDESDVEGVDREALWRQVAGEDAADQVPTEAESTTAGATGAAGEPSVRRPDPPGSRGSRGDGAPDRQERVVDKGKYCRGCEHFSPPPEIRCTHEGTLIEEEVDMDHFRVVNCPVVKEDEELENV